MNTKTKMKNSLSPLILILLFLTITSQLHAVWVNNTGDSHPSNSAIDMDINNNFDILFGGENYAIYGDFYATGASIMYQDNPITDDSNLALYATSPSYMNVDSDFLTTALGLSDSRKLNSSSASISLPNGVLGKHIIWAGLFWQGQIHETEITGLTTTDVDNNITNWNKVTLKTSDGIMHEITAPIGVKNSSSKTHHYKHKDDNDFRHFYGAYVDVTTLIKNSYSSVNNTYTVGNLSTTSGADHPGYIYFSHINEPNGQWYNGLRMGHFGGWSLVVVYQLDDEALVINSSEKLRNISIYDGFDLFSTWGDDVSFERTITLDNFLTPKAGDVNSKLLIFGAGADQGIFNDTLKIQNKKDANMNNSVNISNTPNPIGKQFNSTMTDTGSPIHPLKNYHQGIDLDIFDVSDAMDNYQTSTQILFGVRKPAGSNSIDQIFPQIIGFSTELYEPQFCYDYSYQQNGKYFTEENNGTALPRITGEITSTDDINVTIYIRNLENSDILAKNIVLDIVDINTTQAIYKRESVSVVYPEEVIPQPILDADLMVADNYVKGIDLKNIDGQEYIYTYYAITPNLPSNLNNEINVSIDGNVSYDLVLPTPNGGSITLPYTSTLGGAKMPMCAGDNTKYEVDWGIFNVVSKGIYNYPSSIKYNLPTQVVRQPQEVMVLAHDETGTDLLSEINSTILVGVDLIDVGKFHSVKASCDEPTSALSPIVWMAFKDSPYIDLKQEITDAIADDRLPTLTSVSDYYPEARQNTAYRISYITTNDENESLVDTTENTDPKYPGFLILNNFTELVQDIGTCKQPVRIDPDKPQTTMNVPVACSNAGNQGLNPSEYQRCMECLFGYNTKHICSRDNFSIRPESFNVKIKDINQTDKTQKLSFATDRTGVASPSTAKVNIAAGYAYEFDINATTHTGNEAASGYTRYFTTSSTDHNVSFNWDSNLTTLECNDITDKQLTFTIINGTTTSEANITNLGDYKLNIIDTGWTRVDWDGTKMIHHGGANGSYFVQGSDCLQNNSIVQGTGTVPSISGTTITNAHGCIISTNNHDNSDANIKYRDYNITAHPYKFNLDSLVISRGADLNTTLNSFIYTSNVDDNNSREMALHIRDIFSAQGYNNTTLSNFVTGCYAKDINFTLDRVMLDPIIEPYIARFTDRNSTLSIISDQWLEVNATNNLFTVADGNFTKDMQGSIEMLLDLNFEKNITEPREPVRITLNNFDVNCTTATDCEFQADLIGNKHTEGTRDLADANLTHYYGRVHAPDYEFEGNTGTATILYEAYCKDCNQGLYNISGEESPDSIYWYLNDLHVAIGNGQVNEFTSQENVTFNGNLTTSTVTITTGSENQILIAPDVPYVDRVTMTPDPWLLYNRFNSTASTNDFNVKFLSNSSGWAGEGELGQTVDLNVSTIQNRRLDW